MWAGRKAWIVRGTFWLLLPWLAVGAWARGMTRDGAFRELEVQATGLRVTPKLGDTGMDARLQSFLRLTVADLAFLAHWNAQAEVLELRGVRLVVPGRMDLTLGADIAGADPAAGLSVLLGAGLTSLDLRVVTDGTMARPVWRLSASGCCRRGRSGSRR